jgi:GT2 family glycosyltransferase
MHIETLGTSFNRKEKTLNCLSSLYSMSLPEGVTINHNLVIDGSTDGTKEAVLARCPLVNIIEGDGKLYWAGGMRYGYDKLIKSKQFDYLFVFNDDCVFIVDALRHLLINTETSEIISLNNPHVIVGSTKDTKNSRFTYGGRKQKLKWHPLYTSLAQPNSTHIDVDTLNMNGALIHYSALDKIGFLNSKFQHSQADFEYGLRLIRNGGRVLLCPSYIGYCDTNSTEGTSMEFRLPLLTRFKRLQNVKEQPFYQLIALYRGYIGLPVFVLIPYFKIISAWAGDIVKDYSNSSQK